MDIQPEGEVSIIPEPRIGTLEFQRMSNAEFDRYWHSPQNKKELEQAEKGTTWFADNSSVGDYNERFGTLFNGHLNLQGLVDQARERLGRDPVVVDFMSGLGVIKDLGTSGLGVRLLDQYHEAQQGQNPNRDIIEGDILKKATWDALDTAMKEKGWPAIDIALFCPVGGLKFFPNNPNVYYRILNEMYRRLSPHEGVLLAQIQDKASPFVRQWYMWGEAKYEPPVGTVSAELETQRKNLMQPQEEGENRRPSKVRLTRSTTLPNHAWILGIVKNEKSPLALPNYQNPRILEGMRNDITEAMIDYPTKVLPFLLKTA